MSDDKFLKPMEGRKKKNKKRLNPGRHDDSSSEDSAASGESDKDVEPTDTEKSKRLAKELEMRKRMERERSKILGSSKKTLIAPPIVGAVPQKSRVSQGKQKSVVKSTQKQPTLTPLDIEKQRQPSAVKKPEPETTKKSITGAVPPPSGPRASTDKKRVSDGGKSDDVAAGMYITDDGEIVLEGIDMSEFNKPTSVVKIGEKTKQPENVQLESTVRKSIEVAPPRDTSDPQGEELAMEETDELQEKRKPSGLSETNIPGGEKKLSGDTSGPAPGREKKLSGQGLAAPGEKKRSDQIPAEVNFEEKKLSAGTSGLGRGTSGEKKLSGDASGPASGGEKKLSGDASGLAQGTSGEKKLSGDGSGPASGGAKKLSGDTSGPVQGKSGEKKLSGDDSGPASGGGKKLSADALRPAQGASGGKKLSADASGPSPSGEKKLSDDSGQAKSGEKKLSADLSGSAPSGEKRLSGSEQPPEAEKAKRGSGSSGGKPTEAEKAKRGSGSSGGKPTETEKDVPHISFGGNIGVEGMKEGDEPRTVSGGKKKEKRKRSDETEDEDKLDEDEEARKKRKSTIATLADKGHHEHDPDFMDWLDQYNEDEAGEEGEEDEDEDDDEGEDDDGSFDEELYASYEEYLEKTGGKKSKANLTKEDGTEEETEEVEDKVSNDSTPPESSRKHHRHEDANFTQYNRLRLKWAVIGVAIGNFLYGVFTCWQFMMNNALHEFLLAVNVINCPVSDTGDWIVIVVNSVWMFASFALLFAENEESAAICIYWLVVKLIQILVFLYVRLVQLMNVESFKEHIFEFCWIPVVTGLDITSVVVVIFQYYRLTNNRPVRLRLNKARGDAYLNREIWYAGEQEFLQSKHAYRWVCRNQTLKVVEKIEKLRRRYKQPDKDYRFSELDFDVDYAIGYEEYRKSHNIQTDVFSGQHKLDFGRFREDVDLLQATKEDEGDDQAIVIEQEEDDDD